jgi:aromatic-L-amino-acid decarboxylase
MIRHHVAWSAELADDIAAAKDFEIVTPPALSLFSFRYRPEGAGDLDALNQQLLDAINDDGRIYLTQTRVDGEFVIRFQVGQFDTTRDDVRFAWSVIQDMAHRLG